MKKMISCLLALVLLASCTTAPAESEPADFFCPEENIATKIPAGATARYEDGNGLVIYAGSEGAIPFVIVSRRPQEMKFKDPENYLNNVYREHMEEEYGDGFLGMNPAKTWETGGKELLGARYMYKVGDVPVTLLRLIEIRDGGDVEYTAKFKDDTEGITLAALDLAVQYYRETDTEMPDDSGTPGTVPAFLVPAEFITRFNSLMEALADEYAEQLGDENVQGLKKYYTLTEKDPQGSIVYFGTKNWQVEASFYFPDNNDPAETMAAQLMNFAIKKETPEIAADFARRIFELLIAYEYQEDVSPDELNNWAETVSDPADTFAIPGYTVNAIFAEEYIQYAILPAGAAVPEGIEDNMTEAGPQEDTGKDSAPQGGAEWTDYHCEEDGFTTVKPYHALTQYRNDRGYVGITFYLDVPGFPPYITIHRRQGEEKFKNPEGYLNNTYREFLEDKFAGQGVGTTPARIMDIGGRQLIGAKYMIGGDSFDTTQLQLIEIRDLGDVEYIAMYSGAEEEALVMEALEAAVANYTEDEAQAGAEGDDEADLVWDQETAEIWAEERKAAKEFCAGFSAGLTDRDLLSITLLYDNEIVITLGETRPKDLTERGWKITTEADGAMLLYNSWGEDTGIILNNGNGLPDEPILTVNAFWQENFETAYCGFDGVIGIHANDPDEYWYPDPTGKELCKLLYDTGERLDVWDGLAAWLVTDYGAKQTEEGIYEAEITLSDGRTVYVSTHGSQACISLNPD